jgi:protein-disulfide isomerase
MSTLKIPVTQEDHIKGDINANITLVEYGDYECPYCGMAYPIVKRIQKHFGNRLRFVFRNFPLVDNHPHAETAAMTAEFAATKGKFWEMHDLLFENQDSLEDEELLLFAKKLNLKIEQFKKDMNSKEINKKVQDHFMGGIKSGVNGTPTLFINGVRYDGPHEFESLLEKIDSLLKV